MVGTEVDLVAVLEPHSPARPILGERDAGNPSGLLGVPVAFLGPPWSMRCIEIGGGG